MLIYGGYNAVFHKLLAFTTLFGNTYFLKEGKEDCRYKRGQRSGQFYNDLEYINGKDKGT
jgi:hypothetical protein